MTPSFSDLSFLTDAFNVLSFDIGSGSDQPQTTASTYGWASGSYVTRMTEAEFRRRRHLFWKSLDTAETRIRVMNEEPKLHAGILNPADGETFEQKRARERKLSNIIAKRILHEHAMELKMAKRAAAIEREDEAILLDYLMQ